MGAAVSYAVGRGVAVVCAAGNYAGTNVLPADRIMLWPARYHSTISVGATVQDDSRWIGSQRQGSMIGDEANELFLDCMAPSNVKSTEVGGGYFNLPFTSSATPHVTGLVALLKSINPDLYPPAIRSIIRSTADKVAGMNGNNYTDEYGFGRINAYAALKYTLENYGGTLSGDVLLTENLTIASGKTLTIEAGTTIKFDSGVKLTINGTLDVNGTISNPVTFTRSGSSGSWDGIFLYGNNNQLDYCTVEYGAYGVKFDGSSTGNSVKNCTLRENTVVGLWAQSSSVTIENSAIESNYYGLAILSNSDVMLLDNLIRNNNRDGIYTGGSVVDIFDTEIESNGLGDVSSIHGIYAVFGADVSLGDRDISPSPGDVGGFNTIRNNRGAGIRVTSTGLVHAGEYISPLMEYTRTSNSLHNNGTKSGTYFGKDFYNSTTSTQYAEYNYWGGGCPPASSQTFGTVSTSLCQTNSPTGMAAYREEGHLSVVQSVEPTMSIVSDTEKKKILIAEYKKIINEQPESASAGQALGSYYSMVRTDKAEALESKSLTWDYLQNLQTTRAAGNLGNIALALMIIESGRKGDGPTAISLSEEALVKFSGEDKAGVMFNLVFLYLQSDNLSAATATFASFSKEFPKNTSEIEILASALKNANGSSSTEMAETTFSETKIVLEKQNLEAQQFSPGKNYPNPFNPETTIHYDISEAAQVEITIYNLLGKKVRTLVNQVQAAGKYNTRWDGKDGAGQNVASGVYLAKLKAGAQYRTIKMTLVR